MPLARTLAAYPQARGNLAVIAIVDSSQPEFALQFEAAFGALAHFGIPFRIRDLAERPIVHDDLIDARAIIVFQEYLGPRLGTAGQASVLRAVEAGLGLVSFDGDLAGYGQPWLRAAGLVGVGRGGEIVVEGTPALAVRHNNHPITWHQDGELVKQLKVPVPVAHVRAVDGETMVLMEDRSAAPMLVARAFGRGRIVQWLVSPKIWLRQYFGHTFGLDDVWLRGITWAARKPFVIKAMPPFIRFRFDDCQGLWRDGSDFDFVNVLNEGGHLPSLSFCLRAITPDGAARVSTLAKGEKAEFAPHTLAPNRSLFWGDERGEYSLARFVDLFREVDETCQRLGIRPSRILSDHDHGWSAHAIPGLLARGITYKMNITMPGEPWEAPHVDWHPAPYGSMDYAFDVLPAPAQDFFAVFNHYPPAFEYARAYIDADHFLYHRPGGYGPYKWDMLNGLTRGPAWAENQVEAMARRLADHTRLGLDAMFFGGSITHSHFIRHLSLGEWREILRRAEALLPRHRYESVSYDFIAEYARSKVRTAIVGAAAQGSDVSIEMVGQATVPLRLYVFTDGDGAEHRFEVIAPFTERATLQFSAPVRASSATAVSRQP